MVLFSQPFLHEARALLRLTLPLLVAQVAAVGMGTVDTIFAGRLGATALAAVAVGANYGVLFFIFFMGVLMACSPIVAQRRGAGQEQGVGRFAREALLLAFALALVWFFAQRASAAPMVARLNLPPATAQLAVDYLRASAWSAFGFCAWFALRYTAEGLGKPRPILIAGLIGLAANTLLDWLFMFGHAGFPALGAVGAAWATALASAVMAGVLALQYREPPLRDIGLYAAPRLARPGADLREILRLGLPIGAVLMAEAGLFVTAALLMARFGERTVAAFQVALNFAALVFMIPLSLGLSTTVRVGLAAGAGDHAGAAFRGRVGMQLAFFNAASNALVMLLAAPWIVRLYTADAAIGTLAVHFLLLAAAFQFFDAVQVTANGALRGLKDVRGPMAITVLAYWGVGLPVALALAFRSDAGADGIWWGLTAGLGVAAAGLSLRFFAKVKSP